jgi:undecaprenyl phosphate-alpha-L-ara4FN deformylase
VQIALKVDVDTLRGTREGTPNLYRLFDRLKIRATFLFSVGPDHTGRAIKRAFRPGFFSKVQRTSVLEHYGLKTLLYGTLLPGPNIGKLGADIIREADRSGHEVGVHCWDHVLWQDHVLGKDPAWTQRQMQLAHDRLGDVLGRAPQTHGAAGWQMNDAALAFEQTLGYRYASDARGTSAFVPVIDGRALECIQLPTTLATFDELIGLNGVTETTVTEPLLAQTAAGDRDHVFTLHSELEGQKLLPSFEALLKGWQTQGYRLGSLAEQAAGIDRRHLPKGRVEMGELAGRSGLLALQR